MPSENLRNERPNSRIPFQLNYPPYRPESSLDQQTQKRMVSLTAWALRQFTDNERDRARSLLKKVKSNNNSWNLKGQWWKRNELLHVITVDASDPSIPWPHVVFQGLISNEQVLAPLQDKGFVKKLLSGDLSTIAGFLRPWVDVCFTPRLTAQFIFSCLLARVLPLCWEALWILTDRFDQDPELETCSLTLQDLQSKTDPTPSKSEKQEANEQADACMAAPEALIKEEKRGTTDLLDSKGKSDEAGSLDHQTRHDPLQAAADTAVDESQEPPRFFERTITQREWPAPRSIRVLGYITRRSNYYSFYVVEGWNKGNGTFDTLDPTAVKKDYPQFGAFTLRRADRKPPKEGGLYVIDFDRSELRDNLYLNGEVRDDYRYLIDYELLLREKRFCKAADFGIYMVVEATSNEGDLDLHDNIYVTFTGSAAYDERLKVADESVLLAHEGIFYGPVPLRQTTFGKFYVNLGQFSRRGIIPAWRPGAEFAGSTFAVYTASDASQTSGFVPIRTMATQHMQPLYADIWSDDYLVRQFLDEEKKELPELITELAHRKCLNIRDEPAVDAARLARTRQALKQAWTQLQNREGIYTHLLQQVLPQNPQAVHELAEKIVQVPQLLALFHADPTLRAQVAATREELQAVRKELAETNVAVEKANQEKAKALKAVHEAQKQTQQLQAASESQQQEIDATRSQLSAARNELQENERRLAFLKEHGLEIRQVEDLTAAMGLVQDETRRLEKLRSQVMMEVNRAMTKAAASEAELLPARLTKAVAQWNEELEEQRYQRQAQQLTAFCEQSEHHPKDGALLDLLVARIQGDRGYDRNFIVNLYLVLVQNFFTVFAGEPGVGKTSICRLLARALGLTSASLPKEVCRRFVEVPVEYGWTTKRDLIGYWNPLSNRFESPDPDRWHLLRELNAEACSPDGSRYPAIMLLDEANLSPMEYYWSDWMRLCDTLGNTDEPIELTLGDRDKIRIPPTLRFLATINNDSTTKALSPRLIDRSWVISLPRASAPVAVRFTDNPTLMNFPIAWDDLTRLFGQTAAVSSNVQDLLAAVEKKTLAVGIHLSARSRSQIVRYIGAAQRLFNILGTTAWREAVDFAILQKVLPRINGMGEEYQQGLQTLHTFLTDQGLKRSAQRLQEILTQGEDGLESFAFFR